MDQPFPIGLPPATAFYLSLYLLTWSLHWAFMHYVAGGCIWIFLSSLSDAVVSGRGWTTTTTRTILSWLPFLLSLAITAGVAPLLFIQILYGVPFYTANLLLFWNWLLIIPALIALFYLLYLLQAWRDREGFAWIRVGLAAGTVACVALVGGLWITNHLIANAGLPFWKAVYDGQESPFVWQWILARGAVAIGLAFSGLAMIVGWQLWQGTISATTDAGATGGLPGLPASADATAADANDTGSTPDVVGARWLGLTVLPGLLLAYGGGQLLFNSLEIQPGIVSPFAAPYLIPLVLGFAVQAVAWLWLIATDRWHWLSLALATLGYIATLLSLAVVRESVRLSAIGYQDFQAIHERAAAVEGFSAFLVFAVLNIGLIAFCVWLVARGGVKGKESSAAGD